ncbi:MAG: PAS domain-containing protein [Magnetococcales bacterium]|nr:PAS domain-containing protein [Magnetococcales bacterium]
MRSPMRSASKEMLPLQAAKRVTLNTLLMVVIIALLALWFQHAALNKTAFNTLSALKQYHADKLGLLDQEWQEQAIRLHNRLELLNLFQNDPAPWERLRTLLQQETPLFTAILVTDAKRRPLFTHGGHGLTLPEPLPFAGEHGWHLSATSGLLHRWFALPLWLGPLGHGEMILLVPIENGLLFRTTLPYTDLFLLYQGRIVATSLGNLSIDPDSLRDGTFWQGNQRLDQLSLPWEPEQPATSPQLVIRHHASPLFSVSEILLASATLFALISWLFWKTLGAWMVHITRRITTLGWVAREFSKGFHLTPAIRDALELARDKGDDEVSTVAEAMALAQESIAQELHQRVQTQAELQRISTHNKLLLEAAGEGIYGLDTSGLTTFINPAAARMIGWSSDEVIERSLHHLVHHTRADLTPYPRSECRVFSAIRRGETQQVADELFWRKDNTSFPVEYTSTPIIDQGEIRGAVVVFRDISERIHAEQQAREYLTYQRMINGLHEISYHRIPLQEQLEQALDLILSVPWLAIEAKGAIFLNQADRQSLRLVAHRGIDPDPTLCHEVPHGRCLCGRVALSGRLLHTEGVDARHDITLPGMTPHGHYVVPIHSGESLLGVLTLYLPPGHPHTEDQEQLLSTMCHTLGSMIERKHLEESLQHQNSFLEEKVRERTAELREHLATLKNTQNQLIQSERLAALGGLVAGISHEIKTPVGTSFTAVTYLESETIKFLSIYQQGNPRREDLDRYLESASEATRLIKANLKRASDLILSFKQVAVDQTSQEKRRFDLREYLEETVFTLRPKLKTTRHQVRVECPEGVILHSFPGAISQIVSNFILNSLTHAFGKDQEGTIDIQAGWRLEGSTLFLNYRDNGRGMEAETLKQIYEPFFTTNRNQGGSGLGMHIVYNLVTQRLNGTIEADSNPGNGTEFRIQFPA